MDVATALALGVGVGSVLNAPARKAIGRVIGAAADRAVARLEAGTQAIRSEADAKSLVEKALAKQVASFASKDPGLVERALAAYIPSLIREQQNLEAVASSAYQQLELKPLNPDQQEEVGDDFLNVFTEHAKRASSEELRAVFSKALAGEIHKPGSVSLRTLNLLATLDGRLANSVKRVLGYQFPGTMFVPNWGPFHGGERYVDLTRCITAGILHPGSELRRHIGDVGTDLFVLQHDRFLLAVGEPGDTYKVRGTMVTDIGEELTAIIQDDLECDPSVLDGALADANVSKNVLLEAHTSITLAPRLGELSSQGRIRLPGLPR